MKPTIPSAYSAASAEPRVSSLELFFDLVFVFTITQLTSLLARDPSITGLLQTMLIFGNVWWMYGATPGSPTRYVIFAGTVLVDGFVHATWTVKRGRDAATLTIEPLRRLKETDRLAVSEEGERLLNFLASEGAKRDVRITAVATSPPKAPQLRRS